jgi:hypothetical protein
VDIAPEVGAGAADLLVRSHLTASF